MRGCLCGRSFGVVRGPGAGGWRRGFRVSPGQRGLPFPWGSAPAPRPFAHPPARDGGWLVPAPGAPPQTPGTSPTRPPVGAGLVGSGPWGSAPDPVSRLKGARPQSPDRLRWPIRASTEQLGARGTARPATHGPQTKTGFGGARNCARSDHGPQTEGSLGARGTARPATCGPQTKAGFQGRGELREGFGGKRERCGGVGLGRGAGLWISRGVSAGEPIVARVNGEADGPVRGTER